MAPDFAPASLSDIGADAVKIGMLGSAATAHRVAGLLEGTGLPVVFDPVMVATSGGLLADADTVAGFERLIALAALVTPNLPELSALGGEAALAGRARAVLVKGGHGAGEVLVDRLLGPGGEVARWENPRRATRHTHGTGCTLASAIACGLGAGLDLASACGQGIVFVQSALAAAPGFGQGHGPLGHQAVRGNGSACDERSATGARPAGT